MQTCWGLGRRIVEFEQGGAARATYGQRLLPLLAESLTADFGKGFDATNLRHMRGFFLAFPIRDAVRRELSWTHYRSLLKVDNAGARDWYMQEAAMQNWGTRAPDRQIGTLYYERLLASQNRAAVEHEARTKLQADALTHAVGIILCAQKDASVVRYSVLHGPSRTPAKDPSTPLPA